jgi:hypothetical protein
MLKVMKYEWTVSEMKDCNKRDCSEMVLALGRSWPVMVSVEHDWFFNFYDFSGIL